MLATTMFATGLAWASLGLAGATDPPTDDALLGGKSAAVERAPTVTPWLDLLEVTVRGNVLGNKDDKPRVDDMMRRIDDRIRVRQLDVDVGAELTERADAFVIASLVTDARGDRYDARVLEGWVEFEGPETSSGWNTSLRVGRQRSSFGRLNRVRRFHLPHPVRPLASEMFLGEEGFVPTGVVGRLSSPVLAQDHSLTLTVEALDNGGLPVARDSDGSAFASAANLDWRWRTCERSELATGGSVYRGKRSAGEFTHLFGLDALWSRRSDSGRTFHVGGEAFFASIERFGSATDRPVGFHVWVQRQFTERWHAGLRGGTAEDLDDPRLRTEQYGIFFAFVESERLHMGFGWDHHSSDLMPLHGADTIFVELNFAFGANPTRPFWADPTRNAAP